ncbi:hypothetical protein [Methanobrevibacter sp.]
MKVTKKLFFVALLLSLILSVGAVTAQDNITFEQSNLQNDSDNPNIQDDAIYDISTVCEDSDDDIQSSEAVPQDFGGRNFSSIQNAIDSANEGDTVFLDGKTYYGLGVEIQVNKTLTIVGGSKTNPNLTATLDARKVSRIMYLTASNVVIKGIKFINAKSESKNGGAIFWDGENGTLCNSYFFNNTAFSGGAVYWNEVDKGYISDCTFIQNTGVIRCGALDVWHANLIMSKCLFENNLANFDGGAVNIYWCEVSITDCNFTNNYAERHGGAIRISLAALTVKNSTFENNRAKSYGAITNSGNMEIHDSIFRYNQGLSGGAVFHTDGTCIVSNSSFIDNYAENGGAIVSEGKMFITGNTFKGNNAEYAGTVIWINGPNNNITFNFINNSNSNKCAIRISKDTNLIIENNNFTNPENIFGYDEIFIEFDENYIGIAGKTINFPFYVYNNFKQPLNDQVNLQRLVQKDGGSVIVQDFGTQRLIDGKAVFVIILPDYNDVLNMVAEFMLPSGTISKSFNITVHDDSIVSISQPDNDTDNVAVKFVTGATGIVMFDVCGNNYFAEISDGEAIINVTGLANGKYAVNLIYTGDDEYSRKEQIIIIEVNHAASNVIDVNESFSGYVGKNIEIPVYVHDSLGKPLNGFVTLHGYATQELVEGKTTFSIVLPDSVSVLTLVLVYCDDFKIIQVSVNKEPAVSKPKLTENRDVNVVYGGKATYKVLVTKDGKAIGGENVVFNFNGRNINVKMDSKGYAILNLDTNLKPGTYNIKATFNGISVVNKVKITQIIKASDKKVKKSAKVTKVKISLNKVDGKYLNSKTLKVKFNGKTYKVKTNKNGVAIWNVKKSMLKNFKVGKKVKYTVTFGKDSLTKKLIIKK